MLASQKFTIGGYSTVRGYRENELSSDNGFICSVEYRIPLTYIKCPFLSKKNNDGLIQFALFTDYAEGWDKYSSISPRSISSVGCGIRWFMSEHSQLECFYAEGLRDIEHSEYNIQDDGIHFMLKIGNL